MEILICFIAGMGAGLGTGFAGMSAAAVISPMLITFLGVPAYQAVGIALASDVLASAVSAYTYIPGAIFVFRRRHYAASSSTSVSMTASSFSRRAFSPWM